VGPTHQKQLFLGYQTLINVAAGEPRPQPRSQTATYANRRSRGIFDSMYFFFSFSFLEYNSMYTIYSYK